MVSKVEKTEDDPKCLQNRQEIHKRVMSLAKRSWKSESKYLTEVSDRVIIHFLWENIRKK